MRSFGPTWALAFLVDRDLLLLLLGVNLFFAVMFTFLVFKQRGGLERALLTLGLFTLLDVASLSTLYLLSGTPIRSVDFFALF